MKSILYKYVEIDVLLDLDKDKSEMEICVVNEKKPLGETKLCDPKDNDQGRVPYFNMYISRCTWIKNASCFDCTGFLWSSY